MLGKVVKYELRAAGRDVLPFFGLALVVSGVIRLLFWLAPMLWNPAAAVVGGLGGMLGVLLVIAAALMGFVVATMRFYKSMVSDEGTLSFTLPVKTGTHITGRVITGSLYSLLGLVVALLCGIILIPGFWSAITGVMTYSDSFSTHWTFASLPFEFKLSIAGLVLVFLVVAVLSSLLQLYVSIAIGHRITRNKVVGSIIGYLLVNTIQGFAMLFLMLIPAFAVIGSSNEAVRLYMQSLVVSGDSYATMANAMGFIWAFVGVISVISLAFAAVQWWLTWFFLDKKLNLE